MKTDPLPIDRIRLLRTPLIHESGPAWRWSTERRAYYNLWICTEGQGHFKLSGRVYPFAAWTAFALPPDLPVEARAGEDCPSLKNFTAHWVPLQGEAVFSEYPLLGVPLREVDTAQAFIRALIRISVHRDRLAERQGEWLVLGLLSLLWRESRSPRLSKVDAVVARQIERICSGGELFVPVEALAREAALSRIHYSRRFQRLTGLPPNRFLIRQRIERACLLLRESDWTIETISQSVGYRDPFFFCRQFKREIGLTPRAYRFAGE